MENPKNHDYWIVEIGSGEYVRTDVAYFYEGRWYEITHGEYILDCVCIDDEVKPIKFIL